MQEVVKQTSKNRRPPKVPLRTVPENRVYLTASTEKTMIGRDTYVTDVLKNDLT